MQARNTVNKTAKTLLFLGRSKQTISGIWMKCTKTPRNASEHTENTELFHRPKENSIYVQTQMCMKPFDVWGSIMHWWIRALVFAREWYQAYFINHMRNINVSHKQDELIKWTSNSTPLFCTNAQFYTTFKAEFMSRCIGTRNACGLTRFGNITDLYMFFRSTS